MLIKFWAKPTVRSSFQWLKITSLVVLPIFILGYFYVGRFEFIELIGLYGLVSVSRIVFQSIIAYLGRTRRHRLKIKYPRVSIILAVYNENPRLFENGLLSLIHQDYKDFEIIVCDDGSKNSRVIRKICSQYKDKVKFIRIAHAGKREAMYAGFAIMDKHSKAVLTADSDTLWEPDVAKKLVRTLFSSGKIGAATGYVAGIPQKGNLLSEMICMRYWGAFNNERASQGYFNCVSCVSGPMGAYKRKLIDKIKDDFINQTFLGVRCSFGDDRHLTNLVLRKGYQVAYSSAVCHTDVPTSIKQFIKQQARWGKSYWRETIWEIKALPKHHLYLSYDLALNFIMPFLLIASIINLIYLLLAGSPEYLFYFMAMITLMSAIRVIEPAIRTRNPRFFLFILYGYLHLFVLLPVKFYSLATVNKQGWGTRGQNAISRQQLEAA